MVNNQLQARRANARHYSATWACASFVPLVIYLEGGIAGMAAVTLSFGAVSLAAMFALLALEHSPESSR